MRLEASVKTNKKPLPFLVYYSGVFVLVLAGAIDSLYLLHSHYRNYVDIDYRSFCAISKAINCDTVSQSPYAIFLDLPVAFWGVMSLRRSYDESFWNGSGYTYLWSFCNVRSVCTCSCIGGPSTMGRRIVKVVPSPTSLSTWISPWCSRIVFATRFSPSRRA